VKPVVAVLLAGLIGCSSAKSHIGLLSPAADVVGVQMLRPGATGRSCRSAVLGISQQDGEPTIDEAIGRILALDREGDVLTNVDVSWHQFVTGVYNRSCVEVHADLGRAIATMVVPGGMHH
jgi:hypothetical protein